jgi:hypothetical protein
MKNNDSVNHPPHYTGHPSGIECIEVAQYMGFCLGNAIKYIWRDGQKTGEDINDDLRKAIWYIQREIDRRIDEQKLVDECNTTDWSVRAEKPAEVPQTDVVPNHPLEYLKRKADEGDAEAQWILGNAFLFGQGVQKNKDEAHRLWKLAEQNRKANEQKPADLVTKSASLPNLTGTTLAYAQAGDARRQNEMGKMCYYGDGMPQDYEAAVEWWQKAAEHGNYEAQLSLVNAYRKGVGVEKNLRAADYWLEQAGRQPAKDAQ